MSVSPFQNTTKGESSSSATARQLRFRPITIV